MAFLTYISNGQNRALTDPDPARAFKGCPCGIIGAGLEISIDNADILHFYICLKNTGERVWPFAHGYAAVL